MGPYGAGASRYGGHDDHYDGLGGLGLEHDMDSDLDLERRISPHDNQEYTFSEFYERHAQFHSREDIERYWFEECQPTAQRRAMAVQDSLAELVKQLQGQAGLAGLGDFAADLNLDQNPALSMLSELGRMHDRNVEIESSPALESLDNLAHLDHLEPLEPASMEPVTPRECSVEGCTFFAGAAGLCSECYREEFGREPPEPPPFKPMPPGYYDEEDDDEEGEVGNVSKKKKK